MTRPALRSLRAVALVLVATAWLAACEAIPALPDDIGVASAPLVAVEMSGGRCVGGPCESRATLEASGRMVLFDGTETTIPRERAARIVQAIRATDWEALAAEPFVGECPTAVDGSELTWTIQTPRGVVEVADCTTAVDYDAEPFRLLADEFFAAGG